MARKHRHKPDQNSNAGSAQRSHPAPQPGKKKLAPPAKSGHPQKPAPSSHKGRPAPPPKPQQPKPVRETPQVLAEKLLKSFPPTFAKIPEFLKSCRGVQTALGNGLVTSPSTEELFYLIASCIETLAEDRIDRLFDSEYRSKLKELRLAAGLEENEFFRENDSRTPLEYHQLLDEFRQKKRGIIATIFREHRQDDAARLIQEDYGDYSQRCIQGRKSYLSRNPVDSFISQVISGETPEED